MFVVEDQLMEVTNLVAQMVVVRVTTAIVNNQNI